MSGHTVISFQYTGDNDMAEEFYLAFSKWSSDRLSNVHKESMPGSLTRKALLWGPGRA